MQRTYGRRRRRSGVQSKPQERRPSPTPEPVTLREPSVNPSPPRKRQKVFVEPSTPSGEREQTPEISTQSPPNNPPTRNIRTYAGRSRSFLVALPVPDTDPVNTVEDDSEIHESYTDLRTRWGIDNSEDDPRPDQEESASQTSARHDHGTSHLIQSSLPVGMMNDLKSITELRSKGESRRFLDEVGYLFEGLDSSSAMSLRRASALEVVNKLCDPVFNRRAKASDFYIRTWDKFWTSRAGTSDKIFDATITFFAALAARDSRTLMEVAQQKDFVPFLVAILSSLDHRKDVLALILGSGPDADLKSLGILRTESLPLKSLAGVVSKEPYLSSAKPSARFFVSHTLAALPSSFLRPQYLPALLLSLRTELGLLGPRITAFESGLALLPTISETRTDVPSLYHIEACLRLLDSYLLGNWSLTDAASDQFSTSLSRIDGFASELLSLCVVSFRAMRESSCDEDITVARKCLCGALRVLTLLSHDNQWWCGAALEESHALPFTTMIVMQSHATWFESQTMESRISSVEAFDLLCLALGLVMNWATLSPKVTRLSRVKTINPTCHNSHLCVRGCQCPDQKPILECLTALYIQCSDSHQNDLPESIFLTGYTAVLLGLLIRNDPANQKIILAKLPGVSSSDRIKSLITHCRSFLDLYTDTIGPPSSDSPRATPEFTLESDPRPKTAWDKRGEEIARGVIASLEVLCDN